MKRLIRINTDNLIFVPKENIIYLPDGTSISTKFINYLLHINKTIVTLVIENGVLLDII